jgi:hypothetical protein
MSSLQAVDASAEAGFHAVASGDNELETSELRSLGLQRGDLLLQMLCPCVLLRILELLRRRVQ